MALKGKATIQLFDGKTGEIVNEIHEENMITNAVSTIINPPDFIEFGVDNTLNNRSNNFLKIFKNDLINGAFGGVIVCRDKIEENADNMMLPPTNEEIGHAGMSTTNANIKTGTYNTNESGRIENGKGYRHVWDFGTDKANGVINCVCLTTRDGGSNGYNCAYPDMNMGGIDLTSNSTSFANSMYYPISRDNNVGFLVGNYKWFYLGRKPNGNLRMLGKCMTDHAIYEAEIYDPNAISIRTDKPFCDFIKCEKIIELFDAPSVPPNTNATNCFYGEPFPSSANEEQAREAWEENPGWFAYCPYVTGDEIHIVGTSLQHILHYVYDLNSYKQKSVKKIKTDTPLCEFNLSYRYISNKNSGGNYYMVRNPSDNAWEEMSAFFWDDKYFAIPKNPLVDAVRRTDIRNFHQLEIFTTEGVSTKQTIDGLGSSYFNSQCWDGFYFDDTTKTPLISFYSPKSNLSNAICCFMLTKSADSYSSYMIILGVPYKSLYSFGHIPKIEGMSLPLYANIYTYNNTSGSNNTLRLGVGVIKLCLTTINNLSEPVRKLEGQAMKITYDIVEEDEV